MRIVRDRSDALVFVDAVQSTPHVSVDVRALGCDLLVFSPYKMFGPHQGVLWGRANLLASLNAYKVRPASIEPAAARFETGTPSFEAQAGVLGSIAFLEWLGATLDPTANSRRARLLAAMEGSAAYECALGERLLDGLRGMDGIRIYGCPTMTGRLPTFGFTVAGHAPRAVAEHLASRGIFAWAGHYYAVETIATLGLSENGGLVRVGVCHYNLTEEIDRLTVALAELAQTREH